MIQEFVGQPHNHGANVAAIVASALALGKPRVAIPAFGGSLGQQLTLYFVAA